MKPEYKPFVDELIELCIREDIGDGDHTSLSCIPADEHGRMRLLCKQEGTIAGIEIAQLVLQRLDPEMKFEQILHDGDRVAPGDVAFYVSGRLRSLLQAERILLNIMQRMSGVATQTAVYVKRLEGLHTKVLDTRKTTPGMRVLDKMAVKIGGGENHRMGLFDMILLKDNHIDFAGGIRKAIHGAREYLRAKGKDIPIECEVRSLEDIDEVFAAGGVDRIGGIDTAHAAQVSCLAFKTPQAGERDDLGGVATHDGGLVLLELVYQLGAQATDAQAHRIEHPGFAGVVCRFGRTGNRLLVDGEERAQRLFAAHVEIDGAAAGNERLALVGQIDHGGRTAYGELRVGDKVDRHRVGDGAGHRIGGANLLHGLDHILFKLFRINHCTCLLGIEKGRCA